MKQPDQVCLEPGSLVIGDLHLDPLGGAGARGFADWCARLDVPRLIILGDLFEFWVGSKQQRVGEAEMLLAAMARLAERGTAIDVLWGNRDFLLDRHFERASGARLHPVGLLGDAAGRRTLFVHGDELCTLDRGYQRFKRVVRSVPVRWVASHLPFVLQRRIAQRLRRRSERSTASKPSLVKAMQARAAEEFVRASEAQTLICGHAHAFRDEPLDGGGRWLVVDAWGGERDAFQLGQGGEWVALSAKSVAGR